MSNSDDDADLMRITHGDKVLFEQHVAAYDLATHTPSGKVELVATPCQDDMAPRRKPPDVMPGWAENNPGLGHDYDHDNPET